MSSTVVAGFVAAFVGSVVSAVGVFLGRRSSKEADRTQKRVVNLQEMTATVDALNGEVSRLNGRVSELDGALDEANAKAEQLTVELRAARTNVLILSNHVRRYIPERPFPELEPMNRVI